MTISKMSLDIITYVPGTYFIIIYYTIGIYITILDINK